MKAILDVNGTRCGSCVFAIEHHGRKVQGVRDIRVRSDLEEIHVSYEGNPASLERIREIVATLGYRAQIRWDSVSSEEPARPQPG